MNPQLLQTLKPYGIGALVGALIVFFVMHRPSLPDRQTVIATSSDDTKASETDMGLHLASKTSKKTTKPDGTTVETSKEKYANLDIKALQAEEHKESHSETITQNNLLNIYGGGGVDLSLEHPRGSVLVTYGNHAGQAISDGVSDHSLFYHYRLLSF
jgi:hypothetical protein